MEHTGGSAGVDGVFSGVVLFANATASVFLLAGCCWTWSPGSLGVLVHGGCGAFFRVCGAAMWQGAGAAVQEAKAVAEGAWSRLGQQHAALMLTVLTSWGCGGEVDKHVRWCASGLVGNEMGGVHDSAVAGGVSSGAGHFVVAAALAPVLTRHRWV